MEAVFDTDCASLSCTPLIQAYHAANEAQNGGKPLYILRDKASQQQFLNQTALFERTGVPGTGWHHQVRYAGAKFARIFGEFGNCDFETALSPRKFDCWKLLIDGVFAYGRPLRIVSIVEAFGRNDLAVERLLMPFHNAESRNEEVLAVASFDIALD